MHNLHLNLPAPPTPSDPHHHTCPVLWWENSSMHILYLNLPAPPTPPHLSSALVGKFLDARFIFKPTCPTHTTTPVQCTGGKIPRHVHTFNFMFAPTCPTHTTTPVQCTGGNRPNAKKCTGAGATSGPASAGPSRLDPLTLARGSAQAVAGLTHGGLHGPPPPVTEAAQGGWTTPLSFCHQP